MKISNGYTKNSHTERNVRIWTLRFLLYILASIIVLHILEGCGIIPLSIIRPQEFRSFTVYAIWLICCYAIPVCSLWTRVYTQSHIEDNAKYFLVILITCLTLQFFATSIPMFEEGGTTLIVTIILILILTVAWMGVHAGYRLMCWVCRKDPFKPQIRIAIILSSLYSGIFPIYACLLALLYYRISP